MIRKENHPLKMIKSDVYYADLPIYNVRLLTLVSGSDLEHFYYKIITILP